MRTLFVSLLLLTSCSSNDTPEERARKASIAQAFFKGMSGNGSTGNVVTQPRSPSSCSSDYECGANQICASKNNYGLGVCMNAVNKYNQTDYNYQKSYGIKKVEDCPPLECP